MLSVDKEKCVGCGLCVGLCPESFQLDFDGKSEATTSEVNDCARQAATHCPVKAIQVD